LLKYIRKRLLITLPVLLGVTVINFIIMLLAPGNAIDLMTNPHVNAATLALKAQALGLNEPAYLRYFHWIVNMFHGDLGTSMSTFQPVSEMLAERIGPTLLLMGLALLVGLLIAIPLGILSAAKQGSKLDFVTVTGSFVGISIPNFFLGLGLISIFSLNLGWLPTSGMETLGAGGDLADRINHLILPVIVLSANVAGRNIRYVRSSMLEILGKDYLRTERAKGMKEWKIICTHGLRNALIPIITVLGFEIPMLFSGAVVTEKIFSWPGLGQLTMNSILSRDYPTIMALNLFMAIVVIGSNLLTDILYAVIDPRIKFK